MLASKSNPHPPALQGRRVVVTRASHQSQSLSEALQDAGAEVIQAPAIAIVPPNDGGQPLDDALLRLDRFSWAAFTSTNAVAATFARADRRGVRKQFARIRIAAVGPATAQRVTQEIDRPPDLMPATAAAGITATSGTTHTAAELAKAFPPPTATDHCFIPLAQQARPDLADGLRSAGWTVTTVAAYRTVHPDLAPPLLDAVTTADVVVFASPSAVTGHLAQLAKHNRQPNPGAALVCIGDTTAEACHQLGLAPVVVAAGTSPTELVDAVSKAVASAA